MNTDIDLRRDDRGSIDISFYKKRAEHLRRETILALARSVGKLVLAWLRKRRPAASRHVVGS